MILTDRPLRITGVIASSQLPQNSRPTLIEFAEFRAEQTRTICERCLFQFDMSYGLSIVRRGDGPRRLSSRAVQALRLSSCP